MATEYQDGSFGPIRPVTEALKSFMEELDAGVPVRALHVGSPYELFERKEDVAMDKRMSEMESRLDELTKSMFKTGLIHTPTPEELQKFMEGGTCTK